ncbi:MAG: ABC transporter permease [Chloroflexota bacterium]|nr:ABC transporter permease [Chloroflexota bacterium]
MTAYVIQRILLAVPVVLLVVTLVFLATHTPRFADFAVNRICKGDPVQCEQVRHELGLDKPLPEQYVRYVGGLLRGDLGDSILTGRPVLLELKDRLAPSIELALLQLVVALTLAMPIGIISAIRQDTGLDYVLRLFAILWLAIPVFYLAVIILIIVFKGLGWSPPLTTTAWRDFFEDPVENLKMLAIPAVAGGLGLGAGMMRLLRSQMLEVLRQDFVRTAWAKGLREQTVILRHVLKNAMIPVFTFAALMVGTVFSGEVILESMFSIPGIGLFSVMAVKNNDFPVAQGIVLVIAVALVFTNLVVDVAYGWLDPRIRYR